MSYKVKLNKQYFCYDRIRGSVEGKNMRARAAGGTYMCVNCKVTTCKPCDGQEHALYFTALWPGGRATRVGTGVQHEFNFKKLAAAGERVQWAQCRRVSRTEDNQLATSAQ
eukprot:scaffold69192_cov72-Phaeocystis_antarctica.AAC.4